MSFLERSLLRIPLTCFKSEAKGKANVKYIRIQNQFFVQRKIEFADLRYLKGENTEKFPKGILRKSYLWKPFLVFSTSKITRNFFVERETDGNRFKLKPSICGKCFALNTIWIIHCLLYAGFSAKIKSRVCLIALKFLCCYTREKL